MSQSWLDRLLGKKETQPTSAEIARDRLRVLFVTEKAVLTSHLDEKKINDMKTELAVVVGKYVDGVQSNDITVEQRKDADMDILELSISIEKHIK